MSITTCLVFIGLVIASPFIVILVVSVIREFCDGGYAPPKNGTRGPHDDDDGFHGHAYRDSWEDFTESQRYSGHSYGDSVNHTVDSGRTYGYNERW